MLSKILTNQVGQQKGSRQEEADTMRIQEFLRTNPPSFTGLNTIKYPESFVEDIKKVFDVMHVIDVERIEINAYH